MCHSSEQQQLSPTRTDHPPSVSHSPIINNPPHGNGTPSLLPSSNPTSSSSLVDDNSQSLSPDNNTRDKDDNNTPSSTSSSSSCAPNPLLCTICVDLASSPADVVTIPPCNHSFCLSCLASWFQVRNFCPNCKCLFSEVHCSRDVDTGSILSGPMTADGRYPSNVISLSDLMVCPPSWLKSQLTQVHSAQHDIEHAFELLPTETQMSYQDLLTIQQQFQNQMSLSSVSAPAYACEEIEDELEDQFWQEEELVHQNLMRNSRHTISNRRYGNSGYLAAGRMHARPSNNNNNASSSTVGAAGSSAAHANAKKNKNKKHKKEKQPIQDKRPENVALSVGRGGGTAVASMSLNSGQQQQCGTVVHNSSSMTENCSSWQSAMASCSNTQQQKTGGRKKKVKKKSRAGIAAARAAAENAQSSPSALTEA